MSVSLVALKLAVGSVVSYLKAMADPEKRRLLEQQKDDYVLSEIPRIVAYLEERCGDLEARGCTPVEANIIAHQVIEAQRRTLDEDKRRRLSNVLMNGLTAPVWDKALHRLLVRLTAELEEEHIEELRREARPMEQIYGVSRKVGRFMSTAPLEPEELDRRAVRIGLIRELVARGLIEEETKPEVKMQKREESGQRLAVERVDLVTKRKISRLGRMLLEHLRDPTEPVAGPNIEPAAEPAAG